MNKLLNLEHLTQEESYKLFSEFQQYSVEKQSAVLAWLRAKKETVEEILGAMEYFYQHSKVLEHHFDVIDMVGTGGDGMGTFNISTAASIVVASCGVFVAKHGGRGATSQAGSQDVVQALDIKIPQTTLESLTLLKHQHYLYLQAPLFNQELRRYGALRRKLGFPTMFNILGPLLNPMHPKRCVIGVYRKDLLTKVAKILKIQGMKHALVVHSDDGLDEISISSVTHVIEIKDGITKAYDLNPEALGMNKAVISDIKGGDATENASIIQRVLSSEMKGPRLDIVLLNAAAGLYIAGKAASIAEGVILAKSAIEGGQALTLLNKIRG